MKYLTWFLIVAILGIGVWYGVSHRAVTPDESQIPAIQQEKNKAENIQAIRAQVTAFGAVLQNVSLLSPTAASDIEREYSPFVSRSLLSSWVAHPDTALGRQTSSPWPDHIDISSIDPAQNNGYTVRAVVVLMTSNEVQKGGDAGSSTMQFVMVNEDGMWKIDAATVLQQNNPNAPRALEDRPQLE